MVPTATMETNTHMSDCAASGNVNITITDHTSNTGTAQNCMRSNNQPPRMLPSTPPTPNATIASGMRAAVTPVTAVNVGAR